MALDVTASVVENRLDISWLPVSAVFATQRYWIAVRNGCDKQEWITEVAAVSRVQLNLAEIGSISSSYNVSVKGSMSLSHTAVEGVLGCEVVHSGSQSVSATSDGLDTATGPLSSASASANSGKSSSM